VVAIEIMLLAMLSIDVLAATSMLTIPTVQQLEQLVAVLTDALRELGCEGAARCAVRDAVAFGAESDAARGKVHE
jgi:hypothetical protein